MVMPILHDHHVHTVFSGHSAPDMLVGAIVERATTLGLSHIVILEHVPDIGRYRNQVIEKQASNLPRPQIDAIADEIRHWKSKTPARLFLGAEVDANPHNRDGRLLLEDFSGIDVVLASTHFLPETPAMWYEVEELPQEQKENIYQEWLAWSMHIAANPAVHVLAHPGVEMANLGVFPAFSGKILEDFEKLLLICKKYKTAFELNELFCHKVDPSYLESYIDVIAMARDLGVKISIGSDAHRLDAVGDYRWCKLVVDKLALTGDHFFKPEKNTG